VGQEVLRLYFPSLFINLGLAKVYSIGSRVIHSATVIASPFRKQPIQVVFTWIARFAFKFMGDMPFGDGLELLKNGDTDDYFEMIKGAQSLSARVGQIPEIGLFVHLWATYTIDLTYN
jgi:hypothetical protein